ncbi:MAG: bacterioferritin-associated ferredoxin [Hyphomicrobiaceae bacterium]
MVVCSCNRITDKEISSAVERLMLAAPSRLLTAGTVYKELNKAPCCGGCLPHAHELIQRRASCPGHHDEALCHCRPRPGSACAIRATCRRSA